MTTMAGLKAQMDSVMAAHAKLWEETGKLHQMIENATTKGGVETAYKDDRGNLTEAGVAKMHLMLGSGSTNAEIAKFFDVSVSAVIYRRSRWEAAQARKAA